MSELPAVLDRLEDLLHKAGLKTLNDSFIDSFEDQWQDAIGMLNHCVETEYLDEKLSRLCRQRLEKLIQKLPTTLAALNAQLSETALQLYHENQRGALLEKTRMQKSGSHMYRKA